MLDLALVFRRVEVPLRLGDQSIGVELPFLEATDLYPFPGSSGSAIRACERPFVDDLISVVEEVVHYDHQIREGGHEALCGLRNRPAADRWSAAIDGERSSW